MSSPENLSPTPQSNPNPSLPDDLLLSCIACISVLYYPTLSLVSKRFRSLLTSPKLYKARSLLGNTESCLYVCLKLDPFENPSWFTLCLKPDQALTCDTSNKQKSSGYVLAKVPIPHPRPVRRSGLVAVGSNIYNIGGSRSPSSSVSILDCTSQTWSEAPSLQMKQLSLSASVLDEKIYVVGSCKDGDSDSLSNTFQVFDTKTQIWDDVPIGEAKHNFYSKSVCIDGNWNVVTNRGVGSYNPKEGKWDQLVGPGLNRWEQVVVPGMDYSMFLIDSYCEIENVLYYFYYDRFRWYDTEVRRGRELKGMVGLPKFSPDACFRLANYGGKMAVLWEKNMPYSGPGDKGGKKMIWCAEIALERRNNNEIWGKVEWFGHVLTVPKTYVFQKVIAATV